MYTNKQQTMQELSSRRAWQVVLVYVVGGDVRPQESTLAYSFSMNQGSIRTIMLLACVIVSALARGTAAQQPGLHSKPLFSEDFESGKLDPNVWTQQVTGDNTIQVQSDKVAHGKYALLVRCPAPAQRTLALLFAKDLPAALRHHLFGRAYVYITPVIPARHIIFFTAGTTGFPKSKYQEVASSNGNFQITFIDQADANEDWHAAGQVPLGRWFLLEWEFNDQPDQATVWVDGEKVLDSPFSYKTPGQSTDLVGGFTDITLGFRLRGAAPVPFDIYYDDIALDTHRIGPAK
jgi:hypothetical protein